MHLIPPFFFLCAFSLVTPNSIAVADQLNSSFGNIVSEDRSVCECNEKWNMPLIKLDKKLYYIGFFSKLNWYRASQFCRFHGMHSAGLGSEKENEMLVQYITSIGMNTNAFWLSGTDLGSEGQYYWMSNGRPFGFTNWRTLEPNNVKHTSGEEENCIHISPVPEKSMAWNDAPCSFELYFICEQANF